MICAARTLAFDGLKQLVGDDGRTIHVGVFRCHVTCVLLSRGARLSCALLCSPVLAFHLSLYVVFV